MLTQIHPEALSIFKDSYRKASAELPEPVLKVRDDGEKIVLEAAPKNAIVPPLPHAQNHPNKGFHPAEVLSGLRCNSCNRAGKFWALPEKSAPTARLNPSLRWSDARGLLRDLKNRAPQSGRSDRRRAFGRHSAPAAGVSSSKPPIRENSDTGCGRGDAVDPRGWKRKAAHHRRIGGCLSADEYLFRLVQTERIVWRRRPDLGGRCVTRRAYPVLTTQPFYEGKPDGPTGDRRVVRSIVAGRNCQGRTVHSTILTRIC